MNILFITGMLPFPLDNGRNIRAYNMIRKLSDRNNITLLITEERNPDTYKIDKMYKFCKEIRMVPVKPVSKINLILLLFLSIFRNKPFTLLRRFSNNVHREIKILLKNNMINAVICDRLTETLYFINERISAIKIYSTHNIEHQIMERYFKAENNFFKKIAAYIIFKQTINYERRVWNDFDFLVSVSDNDKVSMSGFAPANRIFVVPNGIDTNYFKPKDGATIPFSIVYTGQMGWHPNEDAVMYFINSIYPLIKNSIPNLKLFIVGSNASKRLHRRAQCDKNIEITGRVEDVRVYIDKAAVCIVPLRIGSGTRLKILEAMSMAKPVISTSIGCEGLDVTNEKDIIITDDRNEFANKTIALLNDEAMSQRLGRAGQKLVKEKYDWSVVLRELDEFNNRLEVFPKRKA